MFEFPWRPRVSLLFLENQEYDFLRAKGAVAFATGHSKIFVQVARSSFIEIEQKMPVYEGECG
jgi:hypothetical protein